MRVLASDAALPPPNTVEQATLARIHAGPDVRLACQLRPQGALTVARLLEPPQARMAQFADTPPRELDIAVLFCDLRSFTALSERQLPYDVVFLLNRYFDIVGNAVAASGGPPGTDSVDCVCMWLVSMGIASARQRKLDERVGRGLLPG